MFGKLLQQELEAVGPSHPQAGGTFMSNQLLLIQSETQDQGATGRLPSFTDNIPTLIKQDTPSQACPGANLIYTIPQRSDWKLDSYVNSSSVKLAINTKHPTTESISSLMTEKC